MFDNILTASLEKGDIITIMYLKGDVITKRNIQVLDIGQDCIKAHCLLRKHIRVFKKDRILAAGFLPVS